MARQGVITYKVDERKLTRSLKRYSKAFGESTEQTTARIAVAAGRQAAVLTEPAGKGKKKSIGAINTGTRAPITSLKAQPFSKMLKSGRAIIGGKWTKVEPNRILHSVDEIIRFVETKRTAKHKHAKRLPIEQRGVCRRGDRDKAMAERRKRAGMAKGSWLGAARKAATLQRGASRVSLGKNFMAWAQKHARLGTARRKKRGISGSVIEMISKAPHTRTGYVFPRRVPREAAVRAWKEARNYYRRELKRAERKA